MKTIKLILETILMLCMFATIIWILSTAGMYSFDTPPFTVNKDYTLNIRESCVDNISVSLLDIVTDIRGFKYGITWSKEYYAKILAGNTEQYIYIGRILNGDRNEIITSELCLLDKKIGQNITIYPIANY